MPFVPSRGVFSNGKTDTNPKKGMVKHMRAFLDGINELNLVVYTFIWERAGLVLLIGTGIFITLLTNWQYLSKGCL